MWCAAHLFQKGRNCLIRCTHTHTRAHICAETCVDHLHLQLSFFLALLSSVHLLLPHTAAPPPSQARTTGQAPFPTSYRISRFPDPELHVFSVAPHILNFNNNFFLFFHFQSSDIAVEALLSPISTHNFLFFLRLAADVFLRRRSCVFSLKQRITSQRAPLCDLFFSVAYLRKRIKAKEVKLYLDVYARQ